MMRKFTNEETDERIRVIHGDRIRRVSDYKGMHTKIDFACNKCGYVWTTKPMVVINGRNGCKRCSGCERYTAETYDAKVAEIHGDSFKRVSEYRGQSGRCKFKCECGYEWTTVAASVINKKTGCPSCAGRPIYTEAEFDAALKKKHGGRIKRLSAYQGQRKKCKFQCECGNTWSVLPTEILQYKAGCSRCAYDGMRKPVGEVDEHLASLGLRRTEEYAGFTEEAMVECLCCGRVYRRRLCDEYRCLCSRTRKNQLTQPGFLYLFKFHDKDCIKFGVTNNVEKREREFQYYGRITQLLHAVELETRAAAHDAETQIKRSMSGNEMIFDSSFNGSTECYPTDQETAIIEAMHEVSVLQPA